MHAGDKNPTDLVFAGPGNDQGVAFDSFAVVVHRVVTADGYNFRFQLERVETRHCRVKRIGNHRTHPAFCDSKTGMTIPDNFHPTSKNDKLWTRPHADYIRLDTNNIRGRWLADAR